MIVLDLETSGLEQEKVGIWQIGALDFYNPKNTFLQESRIDDSDVIGLSALKVIGKTEAELRDSRKQSQRKLIENFFEWVRKISHRNMISQNPQTLDYPLLARKAREYGLKNPLAYRSFDVHTLAQIRHHQIKGTYLIGERKQEPGVQESSMNLSAVLEFCGLPDERIRVEENKVTKEGKPHNALEDAKLTAECFSRLTLSRNLLPEYVKFAVPLYLIK